MILALHCLFSFFYFHNVDNNPDAISHDYIEKYYQIAILEMHRSGVPASITLAQALLETNSGQSELAVNANNHFGIKCKSTWNGGTYDYKDDDRNAAGQIIHSCFRAYNSDLDSYIDHSNFLRSREYYMNLFNLDPKDYKAWAKGLQSAGYSTDQEYANKLIRRVERYNLDKYDVHIPKGS